jgi:oxygen-independent coproporphyrinogen-3 oxidase
MRDDVRRAMDLGLDHLGLYHLVMFRGLGTAWSRDASLLAGLPSNEAAAENWLALRQLLLDNGFYQATLTNFERRTFRGLDTRFVYEEKSFRPDRYEMIGFGPTGISFAADPDFRTGLKVLNPGSADLYAAGVARGNGAWDRFFAYEPHDLRIFYLTRRLAALEIDRQEYRALFGADPLADFGREFRALADEGLLELTPHVLRPTPRGMFYADSIAALLAWRRVHARRNCDQPTVAEAHRPPVWTGETTERENSNGFGHM